MTMSNAGRQDLLPIWHKVTKEQMVAHSPSLADKVARTTGTNTLQEIAEEIASVVHSNDSQSLPPPPRVQPRCPHSHVRCCHRTTPRLRSGAPTTTNGRLKD